MKNNEDLINEIKNRAKYYLDDKVRDERILEAMLRVDRIDFLPQNEKRYAYNDTPVSIGYNQTCSQPSMVAFMLDKLDIKPGCNVLEIGAGCGYASAIASIMCRPGIVYSSEIIPELADMMRHNLAGLAENIQVIAEDGSAGFKEFAPYDRIFVSAGVRGDVFDPSILLDQLVDDGILLYPESYGNLFKLKKSGSHFIREIYYGVSFVPLKGRNS